MITLEDLTNTGKLSHYDIVTLIAYRARELALRSNPKIELTKQQKNSMNYVAIALDEIKYNKVNLEELADAYIASKKEQTSYDKFLADDDALGTIDIFSNDEAQETINKTPTKNKKDNSLTIDFSSENLEVND